MPSRSKAPPRSGGKRGSTGAEIATRQRELYALPPDQFTRARDALAKELASKGRAKDAQAIRKLKRPVVTAWVINRLAQQHPERIEAFLASARALEKAHRRAMSGLSPEHLKEANRTFQQSLDALLKEVNASLAASGRPATGELIRQVEETLRAAALGTEEERSALIQGVLTRPLQSSGFGSFSPLLLVGPAPRRAAPKPERAPPARRTEEPPAPAAPPSGGAKVLRGPWPSPAPKRQAAPPPPRPARRQARESAVEAQRQREVELRQLRREAKQQADEAARAERSARQSIVRTQAVLRTTRGETLAARRALESAEARVLRAREALEAAEELALRAREELESAEESERAQEEEAARADEQAAAAERALTQARRQLEQAESRLHP